MSNQWFRFYAEVLEDDKVQSLSPKHFKIWVNLMCLASKTGGVLPALKTVAFRLRIKPSEAKSTLLYLKACGLLDISEKATDCFSIHGWNKRQFKSDVSTERVKRFRNGNGNGNATPPDTETDTETDTTLLARTKFEKVFQAGCDQFPALATANPYPLTALLEAGCDPDLDIIPEIKKAAGKNITGWKYFQGGAMDAKATREQGLPQGTPRTTAFKSFDQRAVDNTQAAIQEVLNRVKSN